VKPRTMTSGANALPDKPENPHDTVRAIAWQDGRLVLLDQRRRPCASICVWIHPRPPRPSGLVSVYLAFMGEI
ncbi:MAG: hypothetical protein ACREXR_12335, partial [Gammaproteobacteria bacterium]